MADVERVSRRPKMADVGKLARVSAQTVSRYFSGKGYMSDTTRERIESAIQQLGYTFNQPARNLRLNSTQTIGVLLTGPSVYGMWAILSGLNDAAHRAGYSLLTSHVDADPDDPEAQAEVHQALQRLLVARVDGLVVSSPYLGIEDLLENVWDRVPVVILAGRSWLHADSATVDSYEAGRLATQYLVDSGHREILHIAGPENRNEAHERQRGYHDVLASAGLDPLPIHRGDWSAESGQAVGASVDPTTFTAVFAANDQMALGFMSALRYRGFSAPCDYSIVGVDDMPDSRFFVPPLTTVRMDFAALGRAGFEMIIERIGTGERVERRVIHPDMVIRESVAPQP